VYAAPGFQAGGCVDEWKRRPMSAINRLKSGMWEFVTMAVCEICGKKPQVGMLVSHAHNRTKRFYRPNLQKIRAKVGGATKRIYICAACMRSGKAVKA